VRAILCFEDRAHVVDFHIPAADVDERANDRADHVAQESCAFDLESQ